MMPRSINAHTGLLYPLAEWESDVRQDVVDRMVTQRGQRAYRPEYGLAPGLVDDLNDVRIEQALLSGEGAAEQATGVVRAGGRVIAGIEPAPAPRVRVHSVWGRSYTIRISNDPIHYNMDLLAGSDIAPAEWVESGDPAAAQMRRVSLRIGSNGHRFRILLASDQLWDVALPGYDGQYEGWYAVIRAGDWSQQIALHRPGSPRIYPRGAGTFYRWSLTQGYLDNFLRLLTNKQAAGAQDLADIRVWLLKAQS